MNLFKSFFKKKENHLWETVNISSSDSPFQIDPQKITHSILVLEDDKNCDSEKLYKVLNELQNDLNPEMMEFLEKHNLSSNIKSTFILTDNVTSSVIPTLKKLGLAETHSAFVRAPLITLDDDKSQQTVLVLFLFEDSYRRCIISDISCQPMLSKSFLYLDSFQFFHFDCLDTLTKFIIDDFNISEANRILYVGGLPLQITLKNNKTQYEQTIKNIKKKIFLNDVCSLSKLCNLAKEIRLYESSAILISNFPRDWNPPSYQYFDSSGNTLVAKSLINTSLQICNSNSRNCSISIYFEGIFATSYIKSVLASQGCPPKTPLSCKILSFSEDSNLLIDQRNYLNETDTCNQKLELIKACERFDELSQSNPERKNQPTYKGNILIQ
ncbi:MAG: hypothetical protein NTX22_12870 [Ignavibacteriales bacterium]|nr:hypothetical protein [Ignavibacteriales bacterium]